MKTAPPPCHTHNKISQVCICTRSCNMYKYVSIVGRLAKATFIRISVQLYSSNVVTPIQTQLGK
jgi:hypothetical protein